MYTHNIEKLTYNKFEISSEIKNIRIISYNVYTQHRKTALFRPVWQFNKESTNDRVKERKVRIEKGYIINKENPY